MKRTLQCPSLSQGFLGTELHPSPTMYPSASWQGWLLLRAFMPFIS